MSGEGELPFDDDEGERRRDDGMDRADRNADDDWKRRAGQLIAWMAEIWPDGFTSDDVYGHLEAEGFSTHEPRALGPLIKRAERAGLIRWVGFERSRRPSRHRGTVTRWVGVKYGELPFEP